MERPERKDIALAFGLVGVLTAVVLVIFGDTRDLDYTWPGQIGVVIIAGPSAWLAGYAFGGMFGHPRAMGWVFACVGACLSTVLGAAIGGTFVLPLLGTIIAPAVLFEQAIANPMIGIIWLAAMAGLHVFVLKSVSCSADGK
ncbi:MAG: hypothetical protein ABF254_02125 [Octadecabacter sp.]